MKKNLEKAAFVDPYFSETETRQVGETPDKRAVWQSDTGPPFTVAHDARGTRFLSPVYPEDFTALPHPHKTWAEMIHNTEIAAPVGTVRGPWRSGDGNGWQTMVQGPGGWVPIYEPGKTSEAAKAVMSKAKNYAFEILNPAKP